MWEKLYIHTVHGIACGMRLTLFNSCNAKSEYQLHVCGMRMVLTSCDAAANDINGMVYTGERREV